MSNYSINDWKKLAGDTASALAEKTTRLAKKASDKAAKAGKITVLNANIALEKQKFHEKAKELGTEYFKHFSENPDGEVADIVRQMREICADIAELEASVEKWKNGDPTVEVPAEETAAEQVPVQEIPAVQTPKTDDEDKA